MEKQRSLLNSLKWSMMGYVLPQIISPFIVIIIGRILSAEAFGLVAIAMIIISFFQKVLSSGFTSAIIQKHGSKKEIFRTADFVFCFNLILSISLYLLIFLFASDIALFFHNLKAESVIKILSLSIIIGAFGSVQLAILQKEMDFKSIFYRQLAPLISQIIVTLPLAILGLGVWALVIGKLFSDLIAVVILWYKSEWKPKINLNFYEYVDVLRFGFYVMGSSIMVWILTQGDNMIVGKFLSTRELGLYKMGYDLDQRIFAIFTMPIIPVFYSKLCSLKIDRNIKEYYLSIKEYLSILAFPLIGGVILISPYFEKLILGEKWTGISLVMSLLAITGISNLWVLLDSFFKSLGKPELTTKIRFIIACIYIPAWLYFVQFGLKNFLIARIPLSVVVLIVNTYYESKELNISLFENLKFHYKPLFATIIMVIVGFYFQRLFFKNTYNFGSFISLILVSTLMYIGLMYLLSKEKVLYLKDMIRKKYMYRAQEITLAK